MSASEESLKLLRSIDTGIWQLVRQFAAMAPKPVASDVDLDGPHGDPVLRFKVRDWTGPDFKGRRFSELPLELLEMVARSCDYFAQKAEESNELYKGKPVAPYKHADAARARGWAKRIRDGKHNPAAVDASAFEGQPESGFSDAAGFGGDEGFGGELSDDI
jgi:hypothetical protein